MLPNRRALSVVSCAILFALTLFARSSFPRKPQGAATNLATASIAGKLTVAAGKELQTIFVALT